MIRSIVALNVPRRINDVIVFARSVANAMRDNPALASPTLPLSTFDTDIAALEADQAAVLTRAKGTAEARDCKLVVVRADLECMRAYVQTVADANPSEARAIIESAGMSVKLPPVRNKAPFEARQGTVSGSADLIAKAVAKRATYEWQYSTDQVSWVTARTTLQANTVVSGLAAEVRYFFRFTPLTKAGPGDFSQTVSLLVL